MLGNDALSQLKQLKTDIRSTKEFFEGEVVPSMSSFGFVVNGDTRHFLPPTEMERVFAGDRIKYYLVPGRDDQEQAEIDSLLESPVKEVFGVYRVRGPNHFVEAEFGRSNRWLFVPPAKRQKHEEGDLVKASIMRHPFKTGKAAVNVVEHFGAPSADWAKHRYVEARYGLTPLPTDIEVPEQPVLQRELDLTDIPFVTIDSASTRDIDDAVFAKTTDNGFELTVAIADPMAFVSTDSALNEVAKSRATTAYLPGVQLAMLPSELATDRCSLLPEVTRSALVITMQIAADGAIGEYSFRFANIKSAAKLSYAEVAAHLTCEQALTADDAVLNSLAALSQVQAALTDWRTKHCLVMEDRHDYGYHVDENGKLVASTIERRNQAHRLVEECMLATNRTAGAFLASHNTGLFAAHAGFREDRIDNVNQLATDQQLAETTEVFSLSQFKALMQAASGKETAELPLRAPLSRMLQPGMVTNQPTPHFGLGFDHYATITSPIRKYQDLVNHRAIAAILADDKPAAIDTETADAIQVAQLAARRASSELEQWLSAEHYATELKDQTVAARIGMINSGGLAVQLIETGCDAFVDLRKQKPSLDQTYFTLTLGEQTFMLEQQVMIKVLGYDQQQRKLRVALAD